MLCGIYSIESTEGTWNTETVLNIYHISSNSNKGRQIHIEI